MDFITSYKCLEKICSEMYGDNHGVSSYIDEMTRTSAGSFYVKGWDNDLKKLKHCRWTRNKIVHEPNCSEDNMCEPDDVIWIENFRSRIISSNDPLALYRKFRNQLEMKQRTKQTRLPDTSNDEYPLKESAPLQIYQNSYSQEKRNTSKQSDNLIRKIDAIFISITIVIIVIALLFVIAFLKWVI